MNTVSVLKHYKIPFLIALVVSLAVITIGNENSAFGVLFTFMASIIGMFFVDLGAVLHAFIVDPSTDVSQKITEMFKMKDFKGLISVLNSEEYSVPDPTIKSALFQLLLLIFLFYTAIGGIPGFSKALIFSFFGNLLYFQMVELQVTKTLKRWFWMYKGNVSHKFYIWYVIGMVLAYVVAFTFV